MGEYRYRYLGVLLAAVLVALGVLGYLYYKRARPITMIDLSRCLRRDHQGRRGHRGWQAKELTAYSYMRKPDGPSYRSMAICQTPATTTALTPTAVIRSI